jgi:hypothetical protein
MDHVFLRDHPPPKICRPLPSAVRSYRGTVSLATGGPQAGEGFFEGDGVSLEKARDGTAANSDGVPLDQRAADLLQRQVRGWWAISVSTTSRCSLRRER